MQYHRLPPRLFPRKGSQDEALVTQYEIEVWLQEGIGAAKAGLFEQARFRLLDVVEQDQTNEVAWFWLYHVFDRHDDRRVCLENLIIINPYNDWARQEINQYLAPNEVGVYSGQSAPVAASAKRAGRSKPPPALTLKLVAAFWAGISLIFLAGGIIASAEWLATGVRDGGFTSYITVTQLFELFISIVFIMVGIVGLNVAIGLFIQSPIGFYGSLLLAFALLLVGPTISLISTPPNYLTMVCTGGISGMIAVLTLASQSNIEEI